MSKKAKTKKKKTIRGYVGTGVPYKGINQISVEKFFEEFGEMTPEEILQFVQDTNNAYELDKFIYYNSNAHHYSAFNGISKGYVGKSTLGVSHSNFAGGGRGIPKRNKYY